jgi:large subunit ribosomal protein L21e
MTLRTKGTRVGTRRKLSKGPRERGKISIGFFLQKFNIGDAVIIKPEPAYHKGMPYKRFFGKYAKVVEKRGKSYLVEVSDGKAKKKLICSPIHLRRM